MRHTLSNTRFSVSVLEAGAELSSFFDRQHQLELLWQADPDVWPRHAPNLFPMVGQVKNDTYLVDGKSYHMGRHGFARGKTFQLTGSSDQHLVFSLGHDEETLAQYPFEFKFHISYFLLDSHLRVTYTVENPANAPMWFSVGAHPAFRCPLLPEETYDDYDLVFEKPETRVTHRLSDGIFDGTTEPMLDNQSVLPVSHELFAKDALVFHQLESDWVALRSRKSGRGVKLYSPGWPYYGIWAKPDGDFVCLEPWYGRADDTTSTGNWTEKPGIIRLEGGSKWSAKYEIEGM